MKCVVKLTIETNLVIPYFAQRINTLILMHLHNVYGYFHATKAKYVAFGPAKPKQITMWPFIENVS